MNSSSEYNRVMTALASGAALPGKEVMTALGAVYAAQYIVSERWASLVSTNQSDESYDHWRAAVRALEEKQFELHAAISQEIKHVKEA